MAQTLTIAHDFFLMFHDSVTGNYQSATLPSTMLGAIPNMDDIIQVPLIGLDKKFKVKSVTRNYNALDGTLRISVNVELS